MCGNGGGNVVGNSGAELLAAEQKALSDAKAKSDAEIEQLSANFEAEKKAKNDLQVDGLAKAAEAEQRRRMQSRTLISGVGEEKADDTYSIKPKAKRATLISSAA